jgi:ribosomal silencing factor RsfS
LEAGDEFEAINLLREEVGLEPYTQEQYNAWKIAHANPAEGGDVVTEEDAEQAEDDLAVEDEPLEEMGEAPDAMTLLGQEVTFAMGNTSGEQFGHLLSVNQRMAYFQAKAFGKAAQVYAKSGDMEEFSAIMTEELGEGLLKSMLEDSESGIALLEKAEMPPLYIAFRAKEGELEQAAQLVNGSMGMLAMAGEMAAPVEFETGGAKFAGYKLLGAKMVELMETSRESMDEAIGAKSVDDIMGVLKKKNLVIATGTSEPHLRALRIALEHALDDVGVTSRSESQRDSGWTVVDAFDVLFHVFREDIRKSYALEALWKDGLDIPVSAILKA